MRGLTCWRTISLYGEEWGYFGQYRDYLKTLFTWWGIVQISFFQKPIISGNSLWDIICRPANYISMSNYCMWFPTTPRSTLIRISFPWFSFHGVTIYSYQTYIHRLVTFNTLGLFNTPSSEDDPKGPWLRVSKQVISANTFMTLYLNHKQLW